MKMIIQFTPVLCSLRQVPGAWLYVVSK